MSGPFVIHCVSTTKWAFPQYTPKAAGSRSRNMRDVPGGNSPSAEIGSMHMLAMVLVAFVEAQELRIVRNGNGVFLSNGDGYPLDLITGQIVRMPSDKRDSPKYD
jgi:hypothetical protein